MKTTDCLVLSSTKKRLNTFYTNESMSHIAGKGF